MLSQIEIRFSCKECGIENRVVLVREREEGEDILNYMNTVITPMLGIEHRTLSRKCKAKKLSSVFIPIHETKGIGYKPEPREPLAGGE